MTVDSLPNDLYQPPGFACNNCGKCCSNLSETRGVLLSPKEIVTIAANLAVPPSQFLAQHVDLIEVKDADRSGVAFAIRAEASRCPFLDAEKLCRIHEFKPEQCRRGPFGILWPQGVDADYDCLEDLELPASWSTIEPDHDFINAVFFPSAPEAVSALLALAR